MKAGREQQRTVRYRSASADDAPSVGGAAAGRSRAILCKFFGSTEGVPRAVVESTAEAMLRELKVEFPSAGTARETLLRIGTALTDLALPGPLGG